MKTMNLPSLLTFLAVVVLACPGSLGPARAQEADRLISVALRTDKTSYLLGEPLHLTATIEYKGRESLRVNHPLDPGSYKETFEVAAATGGFSKVMTPEEY